MELCTLEQSHIFSGLPQRANELGINSVIYSMISNSNNYTPVVVMMHHTDKDTVHPQMEPKVLATSSSRKHPLTSEETCKMPNCRIISNYAYQGDYKKEFSGSD